MTIRAQLGRLGLFDARVPRYTSYPTAARFTDAVGPADSSAWLEEIPPGARISLYLHVPFCRRLCWFCACRTQGTHRLGPVAAYVETLKRELDLVAACLPAGVSIGQLHWGGGTPTLLPADLIASLAARIRQHLPLAPGARFSVEIDPNEIDRARLEALREAGMNRASIGVQDFDPEIQKVIGRTQNHETTAGVVRALRESGIASLNIDILYGLPHQTEERIARSVGQVVALEPDRVALYGYAHVPWMARRQNLIPAEALPPPEARLELFEAARRIFLDAGYVEIGIDHFARPDDELARALAEGRLRRNFQGYTDDDCETLVGIGASAISRLPSGYTQNAPATSEYRRAIESGRLATARGHRFRGDDRVRARMIEALLCDFRLDFARLGRETGIAPDRLKALTEGLGEAFPGMLDIGAEQLAILPHARPLARMIARHLDAYEAPAERHSHAI